MSFHIFDLMTMETKHPDVYENLKKGFFSFQKSNNEFSRMVLDQVHEQNNRVIKSIGGASDLVNKQTESSLIRWETCEPDIARIINEFGVTPRNITKTMMHSAEILHQISILCCMPCHAIRSERINFKRSTTKEFLFPSLS